MKKALCMILSAAAVLTLLASCGANESEFTTAATTQAAETAAETSAEAEEASAEKQTMAETEPETEAPDYTAPQSTAAETSAEAVVIKEGNYGDEYSQRAGATVSRSGDNYIITVTWSSSAAEGYEWTMTARLDGSRLSYSDCKKVEYSYDGTDGETPNTTTLYENGTGYFIVENGKLLWTGAAENECRECVFSA